MKRILLDNLIELREVARKMNIDIVEVHIPDDYLTNKIREQRPKKILGIKITDGVVDEVNIDYQEQKYE